MIADMPSNLTGAEPESKRAGDSVSASQRSSTKPTDFGDLLVVLERIEALLAEQTSTALCRDAAARFIGVSPAALDRLASANPALRPVRVSQGRVVWRRADLQAYLDGLEQ